MTTRNRGKLLDTDFRCILERNKQLEKDLRFARRENARLRKEKNQWRDAAESPTPETDPEVEPSIKRIEDKMLCIECGTASKTKIFELTIQGKIQRYWICGCGRRGRITT